VKNLFAIRAESFAEKITISYSPLEILNSKSFFARKNEPLKYESKL